MALEHQKCVTVECIKTGGTMSVWERDAGKLVATKRWRIVEPEPVVVAPAAKPAPASTPKPAPKFGEDHED